jgi:hypothetical protein
MTAEHRLVVIRQNHSNDRVEPVFTKCRPAAFRMSRKSCLLRPAQRRHPTGELDAAVRPVIAAIRSERSILTGETSASGTKRSLEFIVKMANAFFLSAGMSH